MDKGGFPKGIKLGEDFLLWTRVALYKKVAFLNKAIAYYNNDIPASLRATRNLHAPEFHMLFKMQYLESVVENDNSVIENKADWKHLLDKLRVNGLLEYWMSDKYHDIARQELTKVDWSKQPTKVCKMYKMPIWMLKAKRQLMKWGSWWKQIIYRLDVEGMDYGKKVIILLDEYDTPMQEAYVGGYWDEFTEFIRSMFNATFKTNPALERAVMTGITRVSKESIFSDLNNLMLVTTTSNEYATAFGSECPFYPYV